MTEELKPCVWCEHEGVLQCSSDGEVEWVRCVSCGRESPLAYSAEEAARRWNAGEVRDVAPVRLSHSAEKEALIEALEPFANYAAGIGLFTGPSSPFQMGYVSSVVGERQVTQADFERARSTLLSMRNNGHG